MNSNNNKFIRRNSSKNQAGFTLVEIMVSISIFTIIMLAGIGALVTITRSYQVSRTQSAITNAIHFAMDSMTRDIRIGNAYYAGDFSPLEEFSTQYNWLDDTSYTLNLMGIPERGHLQYSFDTGDGFDLYRYQSVDGEESEFPMLINLENIEIENALFRVEGSDPEDDIQPSVFIYFRGIDTTSGGEFVIQTFISQRSLDI